MLWLDSMVLYFTTAVTVFVFAPTGKGIPNCHLEYAVTWFLLAATWLMMTGIALWRMKRRTAEES